MKPPPATPGPGPEPVTPAGPAALRGSWRLLRRRCWRGFRFCVRTGYVLVALVVYALFHLAYIGLPGFLKEPLIAQLQAQGLELEYSRIRFVPVRGLMAENVNLRLRGDRADKFSYIRELHLRLDWTPLLGLATPRVAAFGFTGGEATFPVEAGPGEPAELLRLTDVAGELQFISDEEWRLTGLRAQAHGATLEAMGTLTDVTRYLRRPRKPPTELEFRNPLLARFVHGLDEMRFTEAPRVELNFAINGAQLERSVAQVRFSAAGAEGPNGEFDGVELSLNVQPAKNQPGVSRGALRFESAAARTRWGAFESLRLRTDMLFNPTNALPLFTEWTLAAGSLEHADGHLARLNLHGVTVLTNRPPNATEPADLAGPRTVARREAPVGPGLATDFEVTAADLNSRWLAATNIGLEAHLWNATNQWLPLAMDWHLSADRAGVEQSSAQSLQLQGSALPVPVARQPKLSGFWTNAAAWRARLLVTTTNLLVAPRHGAAHATAELDWHDGELILTNLDGRLPAGAVTGSAQLAVISRQMALDLRGKVEPLRLEPLLPTNVWQQVTNTGVQPGSPVYFDLHARATLPPWDTPGADWLRELPAALSVDGAVAATNLNVREVVLREVQIPFALSPSALRIAGLRLVVASGELAGEGEADLTNGRWHARGASSLNPLEFRPLVGSPAAGAVLDLVGISLPPSLSGEVWGDWHDGAQTGARALFAITNATFRGEPFTEIRTGLTYTNRDLVFLSPELKQGTNYGRATQLRYEMPTQLLHITNGFSTLDVVSLLRAIGPKTAKIMEPYHFLEAPTVRLNGSIPLVDDVTGSVVFQASLPLFRWWYFEFDHLLATVAWEGNRLTITNVAGGFYGGGLAADVAINLKDRSDAVFGFNANFTEVNLHRLLAHLTTGTNRITGSLSGQVIVTEGHSRDDLPWRGSGNAQLRNGYLWDLALFGLLSPVFNTIAPGLGETEFRAGNATFVITNRELAFDRIELLSPAMRLQMRGTVDFESRLKLVLEADPLRDLPLIGGVMSFVLSPFTKLLEYDLSGTLAKPEAELRHVPSFLLIPLQPFATLKTIFGGSKDKSSAPTLGGLPPVPGPPTNAVPPAPAPLPPPSAVPSPPPP